MIKGIKEHPFIRPLFRIIRFSIVGGVASLSYAIFAFSFIHWIGVGQVAASAAAYIAALPISFLGQKLFTFRSKGKTHIEAQRFLVVQGISLLLATGITALFAHVLNKEPIYAIVAVVIIIPTFTYIAMSVGVFKVRDRTG